MGITLERLLEEAEQFKETVWYFLDCNQGASYDAAVRKMINEMIDSLESLPKK
jgi:pyruvate/oxaloacetate carboxyltransferase